MNFKALIGAAALAVSAGMVSAATVSPVAADCDPAEANANLGTGTLTCSVNPNRTDIDNVNFGDGDGVFYSLGINGSAVFSIAPPIKNGPGYAFEVTNAGSTHLEAASVLFSTDGVTWVDLGIVVDNQNGGQTTGGKDTFTVTGGLYNYIAFVDISKSVFAGTGTVDGYDLDSFYVTTVIPVPAAGLLLLGGLGGLVAAKRRKKA